MIDCDCEEKGHEEKRIQGSEVKVKSPCSPDDDSHHLNTNGTETNFLIGTPSCLAWLLASRAHVLSSSLLPHTATLWTPRITGWTHRREGSRLMEYSNDGESAGRGG